MLLRLVSRFWFVSDNMVRLSVRVRRGYGDGHGRVAAFYLLVLICAKRNELGDGIGRCCFFFVCSVVVLY